MNKRPRGRMFKQGIANSYDQPTTLSKIPIKEFIILKSILQPIFCVTPLPPKKHCPFLSLCNTLSCFRIT